MSDREKYSWLSQIVGEPGLTESVSVDRIVSAVASYGMWVLTIGVIVFLWLPLSQIIVLSFTENSVLFPLGGVTLQNYVSLFTNEGLLMAARQSAFVATVSASIAALIGVPMGFAITRHTFRGRSILRGLVIVPLLMPGIIMGISILILFRVAGLPSGFFATVLTHSVYGLPFIVLPVIARLAVFDRKLEEGARDLGAGSRSVLTDVTLPIISPAIAAGFIFAWLRSFEDFIRVFFVGGTMDALTKEMYGMVVYSQGTEAMDPMATIIVLIVSIALAVAINFRDILEYV
ncbi:Spermidine Putrescine ABC transporter permease component potC (TC_3.A.1.11.1) [Halorubrum sp. DM2]|uniref:ABC transporter permease n=1 Tax=unclassified Halorubrum TaxID=2642239 RepID=UPI0003DBE3BC|nr:MULTISPECIES: ABC transporter permease [unclassified Halorubrum]CDK38424.1 spermidine/putrescine ABC transporter permease ii [Halorubrum sp. AJ67]VTT85950.1 Spermidine Putrescine ABC transporter permease component potC (TC_3.A.1.11.1) [Halorubrum sp. DM2]